jgi:hypothetical protein
MNPSALPGLRFAIGAGAWAFPRQTTKLFGLTLGGHPEAEFLGRLFGIRDIALGAGTLASSGDSQKLWWQLGIVCDLADAAAAIISIRDGGPKRAGVLSALTALSAVGMGVAALSSDSSSAG